MHQVVIVSPCLDAGQRDLVALPAGVFLPYVIECGLGQRLSTRICKLFRPQAADVICFVFIPESGCI